MAVSRLCLSLVLGLSTVAAAAPESGEPVILDPGLAAGKWNDVVEVEVPPAPNNGEPKVALVADHHVVDGELGSGWRLAATSAITRHSTSGGAPNFTVSLFGFPLDLYRLDGRDLVSTATPAPQHYEPETWDGSTSTYAAATNTWTRKKDGWVWTYGSTNGTGSNATKTITDAATITLPVSPFIACSTALCKTSTWYLSKVVDPFGNVTTYNYVKKLPVAGYPSHHHLPLSIIYNGKKVEFIYGTRKDKRFVVEAGSATVRGDRLKEIKTTVGTAVYSRYVIQYEDELVDTRLGSALTDCDGNTITVEDLHPKQTLLRKIVRVGTTSATQHTLRCIKSHHQETSWDTNETAKILDTIVAPTSRTDLANEVAIPIAANLNFDAVSDLVVIGISNTSSTVRAYVATPNLDRAFASSTVGSSAPHEEAVLWENMLSANLTFSLFSDRRGWSLVDLDGDVIPELLYEDSSGDVFIERRTANVAGGFVTTATPINECDLRHADFADIDGDSKVDMVIRAHGADGNGCNAIVKTKWIRNVGSGTYFDPTRKQDLAVPLEATIKPADWNTIMNGVCAAAGVTTSGPYDINASWELTPEGYVGSHARITDANADGIADIAYSLYGCWEHTNADDPATTDNESTWQTVAGSLYSRIFFGDGQGKFIDSGLSAGMPFTYTLQEVGSSAIVTDRLVTGMFQPVDIDHNGLPELLTGGAMSEGVLGRLRSFQDLTAGWNLASDLLATNGDTTDGLRYLSPAANCYLRYGAHAFGDFNGDGMVDIITLATDTFSAGTPSSTPCPSGQWCATMYENLRTGSEGRMVSSDGPWGGRTELTWGFSAQDPHENDNLRYNLEVIETVRGSEGEVNLTYSGAWTWGTRPTVFAQVERKNARGAIDQFEFITAPWAEGMVSHAARYRRNGTLEHVEVYVRGGLDNGTYWLNLAKPYFNPVSRHCVYEVGNGSASGDQTTTVEELVQMCWSYTGTQGPGSGLEAGPMVLPVPMQQVPLVMGQTAGLLTPNSATVYAATFGAATFQYGSIAYTEAWSYGLHSVIHTIPSFLDWPIPSLLGGVVPPIEAAESGYVDPVEWPTPVVQFIKDDHWDFTLHRLTGAFDYRDTATNVDDRVHSYFYDQPDPSGHWHRLTRHDTRDTSGGQLWSKQHVAFHPVAIYMPLDEKRCGSSAITCLTDTFEYDVFGNVVTHVFPGGASERWTYGPCGDVLTHTDQEQRVRSNTNTTCRTTVSTFEGGTTTTTIDTLGRVTRLVVDPGGGGATTTRDTYYDDVLDIREDMNYLEPRIGSKRADGKVKLSYFNGFGSRTKEIECAYAAPTGTTGVLSRVGCVAGTERITAFELYGSDGLRKVYAEPFRPGETPATHGVGHDGLGRPVVRMDPVYQPGVADWTTTTHHRGAAWDETVNAQGHTTRTTFSTLLRSTTIDGSFRGSKSFDVRGWLVDETAPDGQVYRHAYDTFGRPSSLTRLFDTPCTVGSTQTTCHWQHQTVSYNAMSRPLRQLDAANTPRDFTYDDLGRITSVRHDGALVEARTYRDSVAGSLPEVDITDENGALVTVRIDGLGRVVSVEAEDTARSITWGENGLRASEIDVNGRTTSYTYNKLDFLTKVTAPGNVKTVLTYDGAGRLLTTQDADNVVMSHEYNYAGKLWRTKRDGIWTERTLTYDSLGRQFDVTDKGVRAIYSWDNFGRLTRVERGVGTGGAAEEIIALDFDSGDRVTHRTVVPRVGTPAVTVFGYDGWGQLISTTDNAGQVWEIDRDILGRVRFERDPLGVAMEIAYDSRGREIARQTTGGHSYTAYTAGQSYETPSGSSIERLTLVERWDSGDPLDFSGQPLVTARTYIDALGREVAAIDREGTVHLSSWTGNERVAETWIDAAGIDQAVVAHTFDSKGRLTSSVGPYAPADPVQDHDYVGYSYTQAGRTRQAITPEGTTTFTYASGLAETETFANQVRRFVRADPNATWVTAEELVAGGDVRSTTYTRDSLGRVTRETISAPGLSTVENTHDNFTAWGDPTIETRTVANLLEATTAWTYDPVGRPAQRTVTPSAGTSATTTWNWQVNGMIASVRTPSGIGLGYDYGGDHQLDRVYDLASGDEHVVVVGRNGRGQPTEIDQPHQLVEQSFTYDVAGRIATRTIGNIVGPIWATYTNHYDWAGRLVAEEFRGATDEWMTAYSYNGRGRLASEYRSRTGESRTYTWSRGGNLLRVDLDDGTGPVPIMNATYVGQRLTAVNTVGVTSNGWGETTLDQHGNAFTYTADGEIRSITGPAQPTVELLRDAAGVPIVHLEGGIEPRQLAWDLDYAAVPLEVHQSDGIDRTYISAFGSLMSTLQDGFSAAVVSDTSSNMAHHGDQVVVNDGAFGIGLVAPGSTDERFLFGKLEAVKGAVGVLLARHRSYDSHTGRFQQRDPIGLDGGGHRYLYADGDPVGYIDPLGWSCLPDTNTPPAIGAVHIHAMEPAIIEGATGGPAEPSMGPGLFAGRDIGNDDGSASSSSEDGNGVGEGSETGEDVPVSESAVGGGLATEGLASDDGYADAGDEISEEITVTADEIEVLHQQVYTGSETKRQIKREFRENLGIKILGELHWSDAKKTWWSDEWSYINAGANDNPANDDWQGGGSTAVRGSMADIVNAGGGAVGSVPQPADFRDGQDAIARSSPLDIVMYMPFTRGVGAIAGMLGSSARNWLESQYWAPGVPIVPRSWFDSLDDLGTWLADPVNQGEMSVFGELLVVGAVAGQLGPATRSLSLPKPKLRGAAGSTVSVADDIDLVALKVGASTTNQQALDDLISQFGPKVTPDQVWDLPPSARGKVIEVIKATQKGESIFAKTNNAGLDSTLTNGEYAQYYSTAAVNDKLASTARSKVRHTISKSPSGSAPKTTLRIAVPKGNKPSQCMIDDLNTYATDPKLFADPNLILKAVEFFEF